MLKSSSEQVRFCRAHAGGALAKADETVDPTMKADWLAMEGRWLALARSYEFSESIDAFSASNKEQLSQSEQRVEQDDDARLHELSTMLIQEGDLQALYGRILDAAVDLLRSDCGSMQIYHPERNALRLLAWRGFHAESAIYWHWVGISHHSTCAAALAGGRRIVVADLESSAPLVGTRDLDEYRRSGIRSVQTTPLLSRSGELLGMISTHWQQPYQPSERTLRRLDLLARQAADLIERTGQEERIAVLAREAEHRTNNLLSAVLAVVNLSRADSAGELKHALVGRIEALARVHTLFDDSRWTGADLLDLATQELAPFCDYNGNRVRVEGPNVLLRPSVAQCLAVILHELATNAAKYGSLTAYGGHLDVSWSVSDKSAVLLHWIESDGPPVCNPGRKGTGMNVIENLVSAQLKGEVRLDWRAQGLACEIRFSGC